MYHGLSANSKEVLRKIDAVISMIGYMHCGGIASVTDFNVCLRVADATDNTDFTKQWVDPACGKGSVLLAKIKRLIENGCDVKTAVRNMHGVDLYPSQVDHAKINIQRATGYLPDIVCDNSLQREFNMKFDGYITNPPYKGQSMLHQQFFNLGVDLVADGGQVVCLQPATVYFNKKEETDKHSQRMRDNINKYEIVTEMVKPSIFENAKNRNDISITTLTKKESCKEIKSIRYRSGQSYYNVNLEDVNRTEVEPNLYHSIVRKYKSFVKKNGCIYDITTKNKSVAKARIASMRGNGGGDDWYTFIPSNKKYWVTDNNDSEWGVEAKSESEAANIYNYFTTNFARFGLSIYKFSSDMYGGAMNGVPIVDFSRTYSDSELYDMIELTIEEREAIDSSLPDYYGRN